MQPTKKIEVRKGYSVNVFDSGDSKKYKNKECLVFVHGHCGCMQILKYQIKYFLKDYRIIAFDLLGHGAADFRDQPLSDHYEDLKKLMKKLKLESKNIILIGESGGVPIVLSFVKKHNVMKLVLISYGLKFVQPSSLCLRLLFKIPKTLQCILYEQIVKKKSVTFAKLFLFSKNTKVKIVKDFLQDAVIPPTRTFLQLQSYIKFDATAWMKRFKQPVLIIAGTEDKFHSTKSYKHTQKIIPNSKLVLIKDAGHAVFFEKPNETNKLIEDFIKWK